MYVMCNQFADLNKKLIKLLKLLGNICCYYESKTISKFVEKKPYTCNKKVQKPISSSQLEQNFYPLTRCT